MYLTHNGDEKRHEIRRDADPDDAHGKCDQPQARILAAIGNGQPQDGRDGPAKAEATVAAVQRPGPRTVGQVICEFERDGVMA